MSNAKIELRIFFRVISTGKGIDKIVNFYDDLSFFRYSTLFTAVFLKLFICQSVFRETRIPKRRYNKKWNCIHSLSYYFCIVRGGGFFYISFRHSLHRQLSEKQTLAPPYRERNTRNTRGYFNIVSNENSIGWYHYSATLIALLHRSSYNAHCKRQWRTM